MPNSQVIPHSVKSSKSPSHPSVLTFLVGHGAGDDRKISAVLVTALRVERLLGDGHPLLHRQAGGGRSGEEMVIEETGEKRGREEAVDG